MCNTKLVLHMGSYLSSIRKVYDTLGTSAKETGAALSLEGVETILDITVAAYYTTLHTVRMACKLVLSLPEIINKIK